MAIETSGMYLIAWLNQRPYCWCASANGGKTWTKLKADDEDYTPDAISEAAELFGMATNKWEILDDPINSLTTAK